MSRARTNRRPAGASPGTAAAAQLALPLAAAPVDAARAERAVRERTAAVLALARARFGVDLRQVPLHFDLRGLAAGQARLHPAALRYNLALAARELDDCLRDTVPHEVAHLVCHALHGRRARPHGPQWRAICLALGGNGERCHVLAVEPARRLALRPYRCECATVALTSIRENRIRRGARYLCRRCGSALRPA